MRIRGRLKPLLLFVIFCLSIIIYNLKGARVDSWDDGNYKQNLRVARITAHDLLTIGHHLEAVTIPSTTGLAVNLSTVNGTVNITKSQVDTPSTVSVPCDRACQFHHIVKQGSGLDNGVSQLKHTNITRKLTNQEYAVQRKNFVQSHLNNNKSGWKPCDKACRAANLKNHKLHRGAGYAARVQVETMTLPDSWTVTQALVDRLSVRRNHVREVCRKYGLDKPSETYQPNAWEFLINEKYGLVWCNIFKAASSTWFYNFNLLAGFSETELLHSKDTPIQLARKRYARPSVEELQKFMNSSQQPLSFMIARHPLKRLVSGYRDKIHSGNRYYSRLSRAIMKQYPQLKPETLAPRSFRSFFGRAGPLSVVPSFPQFIQFLIDENAKGAKLDEHWTPMNRFCTPCLVPFDVFAKIETLEEDGNYIIFSAGIEDVIKPKRINRSRNEPTEEVADKFLCQLSQKQMEDLLELYKYDIELFEYDVSKYINCTKSQT
ncbi:LOW QUALITY PROTEIN: carbohydrate sulfotransferase 11 [Procambarus clarkii]|uniref:LOW QUALITY PROTEIN: carbohydrate sulfotransferase 11 n=1 Tax=Procambarus clarkii TaxID=6728 RepID=UPI001E67063C|nr:carbohydrate sulfotransferase 11-like isoform X1 [Procambarus clarkii]XP_045594047.1 carbohydrate sulfotransferase 11-like isoform X1 [Procambarus clarkii]